MSELSTNGVHPPVDAVQDQALDQVRDALRGLKFGIVSIVVQDGQVVQIERTEKRRLRRADPR